MFAPELRWSTGIRYIQPPTYLYHLQLAPYANDGPGIDLVRLKTRDDPEAYKVEPPPRWCGLLPDMSYTWRVRLSDDLAASSPDDKSWGAWSAWCRFRTPGASGNTIMPVAPADGSSGQPPAGVVQWADKNPVVFYYEIQMSRDPAFTTDPARAIAPVWWNLVHGGVTVPANSWSPPALEAGAIYYWRVRPRVQGDGAPAAWSPAFSFTVAS